MFVSPVGVGPKNDYAGEGQQQFQMTDLSSRQRGCSTSTNPQLTVIKIRCWAPDGCLTPGQTGRLTVGCNITLTLTLTDTQHVVKGR
jgi:hypothetical protein